VYTADATYVGPGCLDGKCGSQQENVDAYFQLIEEHLAIEAEAAELEALIRDLRAEGHSEEEITAGIDELIHYEILKERSKFVEPTIAIATAYQKLYNYFNENLVKPVFGEPLPHVILNMSRKGRGHAVAFFAPDRWRDIKDGKVLAEISLVPENTDVPLQEICQTLCHEMMHFKDQLDGRPGKNGYHARSWFKFMAAIGLPGKAFNAAKTQVGDEVEPGGAFEQAFKAMPKELVLPFVGRSVFKKIKNPTMQGLRVKYECPSCGINVRGKQGLQIRCDTCDEVLHDSGI